MEILLVDGSETDVMFAREVFREATVRTNLHVVENGEDALSFLRQEGEYSNVPRPDIVLLGLHLPRMSGSEVLSIIKAEEGLRRIPVVVLTSSGAEKYIHRGYGLPAYSFVTKPMGMGEFSNVLRNMQDFWLRVVSLPRRIH